MRLLLALLVAESALAISLQMLGWFETGGLLRQIACAMLALLPLASVAVHVTVLLPSANIAFKNFDFDVLQSSPVKGGIGLDRMRASDYLPGSSSMGAAMVSYAIAACKARFGSSSTVKPSAARLVRHKLTAECMDRPVKLERESCVKSCALE